MDRAYSYTDQICSVPLIGISNSTGDGPRVFSGSAPLLPVERPQHGVHLDFKGTARPTAGMSPLPVRPSATPRLRRCGLSTI